MKDKKTLIVIIILLIFSIFCAVKGRNLKNNGYILDDNVNKDFIYKNAVYFYKNNKLISKYVCKGSCQEATSELDSDQYSVNIYSLGKKENLKNLNNDYALFKEDDKIKLYNYKFNKTLVEYDEINNYNVKHNNPILIVKKDDKYGVLSLKNMTLILPIEYDYIAIPNKVVDDILDTSKFIVNDSGSWYIMDKDKKYNAIPFADPIIDFNDKYIITKDDLGVHIYDYNKNSYLDSIDKKAVYCIGKYVIIISNMNNMYVYDDLENNFLTSLRFTDYQQIDFKLVENRIEIYIDGNFDQVINI